MGTTVKLNQLLGKTVHVCDRVDEALTLDPPELFRRGELLVIDGIAWGVDIPLIQTRLDAKRRQWKGAFVEGLVPSDVAVEIELLKAEMSDLVALLYPEFEVTWSEGTFRPMVTGPEPMHYDSKITALPMLTGFVNVAPTPRIYRIGESFQQLMARYPDLMRNLWKEARRKGNHDVSFVVRNRYQQGMPPLGGKDAPRHDVALAPGSVWFMDAKMVSHEVVHGEGVVGMSWMVENSGARQQPDFA